MNEIEIKKKPKKSCDSRSKTSSLYKPNCQDHNNQQKDIEMNENKHRLLVSPKTIDNENNARNGNETAMVKEPKISSVDTNTNTGNDSDGGSYVNDYQKHLQMHEMRYQKIYHHVYDLLKRNVDPKYSYHGTIHTFKDVIPQTERLCKMEGLSREDTITMKTAALMHDIGHLKSHDGHESVGVQMMREMLPQFGFSNDQIEQMIPAVLATKLPQNPGENLMAQILCDADLSYLGMESYFSRVKLYRQELSIVHHMIFTDDEWYKFNIKFFKQHHYFTKSAQQLYQMKKEENLQWLEEHISKTQ